MPKSTSLLLAALALSLTGCTSLLHPSNNASDWYRGNTHTHTTLCGHADSSPEHVTAWYHDHGYNFLILSEHNIFIDPATVKMPANKRDDFILIPGQEITGSKVIHTTGMNVTNLVPWKFNHADKSHIIQNHVDGAIAAGGHAILNHPNFHYSLQENHLLPVKGLHMFELFNGHPSVHNDGDDKHASTEVMWDDLLTQGKLIYGVSSDDAHTFQTMAPNKSNPGRGWVMVNAPSLDPDSITHAMLKGDFYASNGVFLRTCKRGPKTYTITVNTSKTEELIHSTKLRGELDKDASLGYQIQFIGPEGKILESVQGTSATFKADTSIAYVRAKITYTRPHPETATPEQYHAWTQPLFTDKRAAQSSAPHTH